MSAATYAGIPLALFTTSAYNTGLILEKRALGRMPALEVRRVVHVVGSLLASPAWLAGFALMLTGLACQVIVLTFEPVSVVQPVLASGVALVLVLSRVVLRERLGGAEAWCVGVMAGSVVLLAFSAGGTGAETGHSSSPGLMAAVIVPSVLLGLAVAASPLLGHAGRHRAPATGICFGLGTGLLYGVASLATKGLSDILSGHHSVAGLAAGIVTSPYLYVLGGCSAAALLLYQAALQACRASILIPVSSVASSVYFVLAGTWLFHEHIPSDPVKLGLRVAGILLAGVVLVVLSRREATVTAASPAVDAAVSRSAVGSARGVSG
ncbi:MAG TPA: DMT family transporter [Streptosporangiaceae bacterium]|nr:DMT family transporter [Streptosporangiaceae bacterium]